MHGMEASLAVACPHQGTPRSAVLLRITAVVSPLLVACVHRTSELPLASDVDDPASRLPAAAPSARAAPALRVSAAAPVEDAGSAEPLQQKSCGRRPRSSPAAPGSAEPSTRVGGPPEAAPHPTLLGKPGGHLDAAEVQRIVRHNYGRFRLCYEQNLSCSPNLEPRIAVRFVIDIDGQIKQVTLVSSDAASSALTACVIGAFREIAFPPPKGGTVSVVYPIMFSAGG